MTGREPEKAESETSRRKRRTHSATFKSKAAQAAVRGDKTLAELAKQFDVHPNQITDWKNQLVAQLKVVFGGDAKTAQPPVDLKALHAKIGQLALENVFIEAAYQGRHTERKKMIDRTHDHPICRQAQLVGISRGAVYYLPQSASPADLALMRC